MVILTDSGRIEREIPLTASEPSNLAFGGADGRTIFVTQRKGGRVQPWFHAAGGLAVINVLVAVFWG